jgi:O-antigen/teichoic acid export membrane protein
VTEPIIEPALVPEPPDAVRRLLGRGSIYTLGMAVQAAGAWLILPVVTRVLDPGQFGVVTACTVVVQLLSTLVALGAANPILRLWYQGDEGPAEARSMYLFAVLAGAGLAVVAFLTGPLWVRVFDGVTFDRAMQLAVVSSALLGTAIIGQAIVRARELAGVFVVLTVLMSVVGPGIGIALAAAHGPAGYVAGLALGYAAGAVVGLVVSRPTTRHLTSRVLVRQTLAIGLPTIPHSIALYLISAADRVVIEQQRGLVDVGRYQLAYVVGTLGITLLTAINNAWAPIVYGAADHERWEVLARTSSVLLTVGALLGGSVALVAPVALGLIAPSSYRVDELTSVTAVLAVAVVPMLLYQSNVQVLFQRGRTGTLGWASPVAAVVNIALTIVLVARWGLIGAAVATVASYCLQAVVIRAAARRLETVPWRPRTAARAWLVAGALAAAGWALPTSAPATVVRLVVAAAVVVASGAVVRRALRATPVASVPVAGLAA